MIEPQAWALQWVAYRAGPMPSRRALRALVQHGLASAPSATDANYRLTAEGGRMLRQLGLAQDSTNTRPLPLPQRRT